MNTVITEAPRYRDGRPYRGLHARYGGQHKPRDCRRDCAVRLSASGLDWKRFWDIADQALARRGYSRNSRALHRYALRGFYRFSRRAPSLTTRALVRDYLHTLATDHASWNWVGMTICALRNCFDKIGGLDVTRGLRTPKRPRHLPAILAGEDVCRLLDSAPTVRDRLMLALLFGCGLKIGEVCALTWSDVDLAERRLRVRFARGTRERWVDLPEELLPVLGLGIERCQAQDYVFQGRQNGRHLSTRAAELIVRAARRESGIGAHVTAMTLRHSFAVHALEQGQTIRAVQEALGHESVETTLLYERCSLPAGVASPLTRVREAMERVDATTPEPGNGPTSPLEREPCVAGDEPKHSGSDARGNAVAPVAPASETDPGRNAPLRSLEPLLGVLLAGVDAAGTTLSRAARFYRALKTHVSRRFLCASRSTAGPAC